MKGVFINEQGEIAVSGRVANGDDHAFRPVPVDDRSGNSVEERQMSSSLDEPLAEIVHEPATQEAMAAFAARSAHRNCRLREQATEISSVENARVNLGRIRGRATPLGAQYSLLAMS